MRLSIDPLVTPQFLCGKEVQSGRIYTRIRSCRSDGRIDNVNTSPVRQADIFELVQSHARPGDGPRSLGPSGRALRHLFRHLWTMLERVLSGRMCVYLVLAMLHYLHRG